MKGGKGVQSGKGEGSERSEKSGGSEKAQRGPRTLEDLLREEVMPQKKEDLSASEVQGVQGEQGEQGYQEKREKFVSVLEWWRRVGRGCLRACTAKVPLPSG